MLGPTEIGAKPGEGTYMSARAQKFNNSDCGQRLTISFSSADCTLADFPWTGVDGLGDRRAYSLGFTRLETASYGVEDKLVMKAIVGDFEESSNLRATITSHLRQCGAEIIAEENGVPLRLGLAGGVVELSNESVVVLAGFDGWPVDNLIDAAVQRAR